MKRLKETKNATYSVTRPCMYVCIMNILEGYVHFSLI